jgi:hypothetical protein
MSDSFWSNVVVVALQSIGPPGTKVSCKDIYPRVERLAPRVGRPLSKDWKSRVRQALQSHCPSCPDYQGGVELFEHHARDVWSLKPHDLDLASGGVRRVPYKNKLLARAIAQAKGESDIAPYLAKMDNKVNPKTGAVVAPDTKGAIHYGIFALKNAAVRATYNKLTSIRSNPRAATIPSLEDI